MTISAGTALAGRWHLTSVMASGGMADVYLARDLDEDLEVAVKLLRGGVTDGARRFESEVAALERLQHPHIVSLLGAGEHDGTPYLVMPFVDGPSLAHRLRDGPLELHELQRIGTQVAEALAYAHAHGVVHRDIKPSNVLFDPDGRTYLADFGIARLADASSITATGTTLGTASYVAPEQLTDRDGVGPAADVYSLGLVLLESVTGRRCFDGPPTAAAMARLTREPEIPDAVPPAWRRLLRSMTAREPAARPSAEQAADLLASGVPLDRTHTLVLPETPKPAPANDGPPAGDRPPAPDAPTQPFEVPTDTADERAIGAGTAADGRARHGGPPHRPRRLVFGASVAFVGLVAVLVLAAMASSQEDTARDTADGTPPDDPQTTELPRHLEEAFARLHEAPREAEPANDEPEPETDEAEPETDEAEPETDEAEPETDEAEPGPSDDEPSEEGDPQRGRDDDGGGAGDGPPDHANNGDGPPDHANNHRGNAGNRNRGNRNRGNRNRGNRNRGRGAAPGASRQPVGSSSGQPDVARQCLRDRARVGRQLSGPHLQVAGLRDVGS